MKIKDISQKVKYYLWNFKERKSDLEEMTKLAKNFSLNGKKEALKEIDRVLEDNHLLRKEFEE